MLASDEDDTEILPVSEEVKAYEPIIQKYAKEHGIPDYVLLIEAVMMQESGGRGTDPMQCSECSFNTLYPHTPGSITDQEYPINVGKGDGTAATKIQKATPHNVSCGLRQVFCPIRAVLKMGNTQSIPTFPEPSSGSKSLAESPCPIMRCCLKSRI